MIPSRAVSKFGTLARIYTFFIPASQCGCTIRIRQALILLAANVWIWIRLEVLAEHWALMPHFSKTHGSTHSRFKQVWVKGHSESVLQPAVKKMIPFVKQFLFQKLWYPNLCSVNLRSSQIVYGSPMNPVRQTQIALWLLARQSAFSPQTVEKQGSWHFSWMHARWAGHSGSEVHSGLGAENKVYITCKTCKR